MNDLNFVVRKGDGWEIKVSHTAMGDGPIGPRLSKGTPYPNYGTRFKTKTEAEKIKSRWEDWYFEQPYVKKKMQNKKRGRKV